MEVYLVGGAVRDGLLGLPVKDRDWVVVGATANEMLSQGYTQVGKDFPVFLHPKTQEEYALARTERKVTKGYGGFEVSAGVDVTLEEDLARRDLTINAIAEDESGKLIDPYGGQADLKKKRLRHVTAAFSEDPLRVLRVARFMARLYHKGFYVDEQTLALMIDISTTDELSALAAERVWVEVDKSLMAQSPSLFFLSLKDCGALLTLFPEIDALFGVDQRQDYHPEIDAGVHTMMVLDQAAKMGACPEVRFAALVHDLGKADTPPELLPRHIGHEKRSVTRIKQLCCRLKIPKRYHELAVLVAQYHTQCHQAFELKPSTLLRLLEALDCFRRPERLAHFLQACRADSLGRKGFEESEYPQADYLMAAYKTCVSVDVKLILAEGFKGGEVKVALQKERITLITLLKKHSTL